VTAPSAQAGPARAPQLAAGLARFARGLRPDDIAPAAARHVTTLTLDAIGCALAGWDGEETPLVLAAARRLGGHPGPGDAATIIGDDSAASPLTAVLANAYLSTAITA